MTNSAWKPQSAPQYKYKKQVFERTIATSSFVYQIGEYEALRKPSRPVPVSKIAKLEFQKKISYIKSSLKKYRELTGYGRGITAVQLGIPECFSVIYMPERKQKFFVIINPKITKRSSMKLLYPEMCMSASPLIAPTVRPSWIEFSYYDEKGEEQYWSQKDDTKEGLMYNRVFQHEIDHMNGIINIDKVKSVDLIFESDPTFYDRASFIEVQQKKRKKKKVFQKAGYQKSFGKSSQKGKKSSKTPKEKRGRKKIPE